MRVRFVYQTGVDDDDHYDHDRDPWSGYGFWTA
jgi:hypothetical protein